MSVDLKCPKNIYEREDVDKDYGNSMKIPAIFSILLFTFLLGCATSPNSSPRVTAGLNSLEPAATVYGDKVIHLNVPNRLSMLQMRQAILNAAYDEKWEVTDVGLRGESGFIQMQKKNVFAEAYFTFLFGPTVVNGYSNSYSVDITGKPTRRYTPPLWMDRIRDRIKTNLENEMAGF